jgi:membrane protein
MSGLEFYWNVLKKSVSKFIEDDIFTHSAALSYYAIFSLPPMLLIVLSITNIFYKADGVKGVLFDQIEVLVGNEGAQQLIESIENIHVFESTIWGTIISIAVLIFTSTTGMVTMQNALNKIFNVKPKPENSGFLEIVRDRFLSFALLISFSIILIISLVVDTLITAFESYMEDWIVGSSTTLTLLSSTALSFIIITLELAMIFKFLPDVKLKWKDVWFGAILTSILLGLSKYLISFYIGKSNIAGLYDAAGSVMVIMVWVFYIFLIILFGAIFTYSRIKMLGESLPTSDNAIKIE